MFIARFKILLHRTYHFKNNLHREAGRHYRYFYDYKKTYNMKNSDIMFLKSKYLTNIK